MHSCSCTLAVLCHLPELITVLIDGYTHNSILTSGDSVPLGSQFILVCRIVGLPYGTPLSYTWTCPNGPCEVEGYFGRKVYNEHILAVNTTSTSDGGTYTCQVTATGGQEARGSFTLIVTGMCVCIVLYCSSNGTGTSLVLHTHSGGRVVHSYGRLIPHEFPITDLQQISGPDGIGRITCTVSSGTARFGVNGRQLETGGVSQTRNGATATLVVKPSNVDSFQNRGLYCTNINNNYFYLFISSASEYILCTYIICKGNSIHRYISYVQGMQVLM